MSACPLRVTREGVRYFLPSFLEKQRRQFITKRKMLRLDLVLMNREIEILVRMIRKAKAFQKEGRIK